MGSPMQRKLWRKLPSLAIADWQKSPGEGPFPPNFLPGPGCRQTEKSC
jgi:hypothetical protein